MPFVASSVHAIMMVVVMVMMMHLARHRSGRSGWSRSGFLRDGVTGEAEREHGGCDKGLDHEKVFLWFGEPQRVMPNDRAFRLNST